MYLCLKFNEILHSIRSHGTNVPFIGIYWEQQLTASFYGCLKLNGTLNFVTSNVTDVPFVKYIV
jgi:hypothetical protein